MKLSIIVPLFNQVEFVEEAVGSALAQTVASEVIVINDGSTDGGGTLVSSKFPQVRLINQVNKGLASARNTGIMAAKGDYILPLDSDDLLMPNCVERILEVAEETHADIIAPSIHCFGKGDQTTLLMENPTIEDFKMGNRISYCSAIKKNCLLEVGGYSPKYDALGGYEDLALTLDLLTRGKKIVTIPEPLMQYRIKETSMWTEASKPEKHIPLMQQLFKDFPHVWDTEELRELVKKQYPVP